jgi:hypothetical protein
LKKPSVAFPTSSFEKRGFQMTLIFGGCKPSKMAVHPCTGRSLLKNEFFNRLLGPDQANYWSADILEHVRNEDSQIRWLFRVGEILGNHFRFNRQFRVGGLWLNANDRD